MLHTDGKGFTDWGGGIGFNFANPLGPVDASAYSGIAFTASGSSPMHVGLATVATIPDFEICKKCYDNYYVEISDLTPTPKTYTYTWAQLKAGGSWDFSIKEVHFVK